MYFVFVVPLTKNLAHTHAHARTKRVHSLTAQFRRTIPFRLQRTALPSKYNRLQYLAHTQPSLDWPAHMRNRRVPWSPLSASSLYARQSPRRLSGYKERANPFQPRRVDWSFFELDRSLPNAERTRKGRGSREDFNSVQ